METSPSKATLTWEQEIEQWKKAMELQKEGFLSRVQALEEENKKLSKLIQVNSSLALKFEQSLKEENKRLQERLSAAEEAIEWLETTLPHNK